MFDIEREIAEWRGRLASGGSIDEERLGELESHLRDAVDDLAARGLDPEECFLVATRRVGNLDAVAGEFARAGGEAGWRRLVLAPEGGGDAGRRLDLAITAALALLAGLLAKLPWHFGQGMAEDTGGALFLRNAALACLPSAALLLAWLRSRRRGVAADPAGAFPSWRGALLLVAATAAIAVLVNTLGWVPKGQTSLLTAIHLPLFLWIGLLPLYAGAGWRDPERRMDFVRFTGESFIYGVLLLCGLAVLTAFTQVLFQSVGLKLGTFSRDWIMILGVFAAPIVAMRLALAKRAVVETIAPILARIFGPLFLAATLAFIAVSLAGGHDPFASRDSLIVFDLVLALVFALVLYSTAMRDPRAVPGAGDYVDFGLAAAAFAIDLALLVAISGRIGSWGLTPNRLAALGENLILLVELGGVALLLARTLFARRRYEPVIGWQTGFVVPLFAWAGLVALGFPLIFGGA